jgi:plasmid maintenance system killer protein
LEILFDSDSFREQCNSEKELLRRQGLARAKLIRRRLDDLDAAANLQTMRNLPGRCHELKGGRQRTLSLDLDGPYRLLFRAAHNPPPVTKDGGLDWAAVTAIVIMGIEDTHD